MTDPRDTYATALRQLADLLPITPELPIPDQIRPSGFTFYVSRDHATIWAIADLMTDVAVERDPSVDFPVTISGTLAGLPAVVRVCARLALAEGQRVSAPELNPRLAALVRVQAAS